MTPIREGQGAIRWRNTVFAVAAVLLCACEPTTHTVGVVSSPEDPARPRASMEASPGVEIDAARESGATAFGRNVSEDTSNGEPAASQHDDDGASIGFPGPDQAAGAGGNEDAQRDDSVVNPNTTAMTPTVEAAGCPRELAQPRQVDMYLLVDRALSLDRIPTPGALIEAGLSEFVLSREAQGAGAAMMAVRNQCSPWSYLFPDVAWDLLSRNAERILDVVRGFNISVAQPEAALQAAYAHTRRRANNFPKYRQVMVLITDGFDFGFCSDSTPESTIQKVADGLAGDPPIPTYVVALGTRSFNPLDLIPGSLSLRSLAQAGGTRRARVADVGQGGAAVAAALEDVRQTAQPCEYAIPDDMDSPALWLAGDTAPLPQVADADACDRDGGFYNGEDDASGFLVACPISCQRIREAGHNNVLMGSPCE